jgi:hypothetical protein
MTGTAFSDLHPELFVEKVGDCVERRFDQGDGAADGEAAADEVTDGKGHTEVDYGKRGCLGHDVLLPAVQIIITAERKS